MAAQFS